MPLKCIFVLSLILMWLKRVSLLPRAFSDGLLEKEQHNKFQVFCILCTSTFNIHCHVSISAKYFFFSGC